MPNNNLHVSGASHGMISAPISVAHVAGASKSSPLNFAKNTSRVKSRPWVDDSRAAENKKKFDLLKSKSEKSTMQNSSSSLSPTTSSSASSSDNGGVRHEKAFREISKPLAEIPPVSLSSEKNNNFNYNNYSSEKKQSIKSNFSDMSIDLNITKTFTQD